MVTVLGMVTVPMIVTILLMVDILVYWSHQYQFAILYNTVRYRRRRWVIILGRWVTILGGASKWGRIMPEVYGYH